jgi:hypothetical protein
MRLCLPGINVNPRTGLVKPGNEGINPKPVAAAGFVLPIN